MPARFVALSVNKKGFTLVELLVTISIIAILSAVGTVSFIGIRNRALDTKKKADIDSIKKAYEANYDPTANSGQGGYKELKNEQFASGKIPTPSEGKKYFNVTDGNRSGFKTCAALSGNPAEACNQQAQNCFCQPSTAGTIPPDAVLSGDYAELGLGGSTSAPACDPNGTLTAGLVGYWKMDEGSGNTITDLSGNALNGNLQSANWVTDTSQCVSGTCISAGSSQYAYVPPNPKLNITSNVTYNIWIRLTQQSSNNWPQLLGRNTHISYGFRQNKGSNNVYFEYGNNLCNGTSGNFTSKGITDNITYNQWHMLTMTQDGINIRTFLDGNQIGNPTALTSFCSDTTANLYFLAYLDVLGRVDEARIYNRALTPQEIGILANGCIAP